MWSNLKRLSRGIVLIAAASAVLLASDVRRPGSSSGSLPRIAILQHASTLVLDESVQGMVDGLAGNGYKDGETAIIKIFNSQAEMATANAIAREITDGSYDVVLTSSTPSLQAVANANKAGRVMHVFGLVADPYGSGVGLDAANPLNHPWHLVGYGSFIPVIDAFRIARRMLPSLKTVGVAWNPAESNSRMFMGKAREACQELDITLLEAQVENTAGVREAIQSVISRGAQAIWVGGDVTVSSAIDTVMPAARQAGIPVFSLLPGADLWTLFALGLDFHEVGRLTGDLAARILHGADPAAIPIQNAADLVPRRFFINEKVLADLKAPWRIPDDLLKSADLVVDDKGVHYKAGKNTNQPRKP